MISGNTWLSLPHIYKYGNALINDREASYVSKINQWRWDKQFRNKRDGSNIHLFQNFPCQKEAWDSKVKIIFDKYVNMAQTMMLKSSKPRYLLIGMASKPCLISFSWKKQRRVFLLSSVSLGPWSIIMALTEVLSSIFLPKQEE